MQRPGRADDYPTYARLFVELGLEDPPPPVSMWEQELASRTFLVEGPGGVVGYTSTEALGVMGYVGQLVVAPTARRQGLGRWMMLRSAERLRTQGCQHWCLMVVRDNTPALELYGSLGMRRARQATDLEVTRAHVATLPEAPRGLRVSPVESSDGEPLTEAFGMIPGKLARFSSLASHQLFKLTRGEGAATERLGVMDLRSGGVVLYPFFAVSLAHARALLEDAFTRVGPARQSLGVVMTDNPSLEDALRKAGARTRLETYELRGELPR
ncbi:GNAT family N-acetyltransferase [Myxococcus sp. K38C18041901]|uniref:GNAT family N-acetyltransferase n=1 Tax=Myxococcus guangdongensis TaxID=2906760 RepID=UPI0020A7629E|nr:GNAT family N-acetyltransferase [Myxococcus guangdongensis]MCP3058519.1 GNAT family N-acetyltransferase [Myxococcus guangdongensis]